MPPLPPGLSPEPTHVFKLTTVSSVEEAERIAGFKARRPTRGVFFSAAVGMAFNSPVILVANRFGPGPNDLETTITDVSTKAA